MKEFKKRLLLLKTLQDKMSDEIDILKQGKLDLSTESKERMLSSVDSMLTSSREWNLLYKNLEKMGFTSLPPDTFEAIRAGILTVEGFTYCFDNLETLIKLDKVAELRSNVKVRKISNEVKRDIEDYNAAVKGLEERLIEINSDAIGLDINDKPTNDTVYLFWVGKMADIGLQNWSRSKEILKDIEYYDEDVVKEFIRILLYDISECLEVQLSSYVSVEMPNL